MIKAMSKDRGALCAKDFQDVVEYLLVGKGQEVAAI